MILLSFMYCVLLVFFSQNSFLDSFRLACATCVSCVCHVRVMFVPRVCHVCVMCVSRVYFTRVSHVCVMCGSHLFHMRVIYVYHVCFTCISHACHTCVSECQMCDVSRKKEPTCDDRLSFSLSLSRDLTSGLDSSELFFRFDFGRCFIVSALQGLSSCSGNRDGKQFEADGHGLVSEHYAGML